MAYGGVPVAGFRVKCLVSAQSFGVIISIGLEALSFESRPHIPLLHPYIMLRTTFGLFGRLFSPFFFFGIERFVLPQPHAIEDPFGNSPRQ